MACGSFAQGTKITTLLFTGSRVPGAVSFKGWVNP
jgi:hypothetical protein